MDLHAMEELTDTLPEPIVATVPRTHLMNDTGNALGFVDQCGSGIRYVSTRRRWLLWNSTRWVWDHRDEIVCRAQGYARSRLDAATKITDEDRRKREVQYALRMGDAAKIRAMIELAQSDPRVAVAESDLDTEPYLLGVRNGVVDLRTGQLRTARQADMITKSAGTVFDGTAECPLWLKFLDRVLASDQSLIRYVQKAVGCSLTGDIGEQCFHFLHGGGCNGKSTFIEVIQALLGEYARRAPQTLFSVSPNGREPQNEVARLAGARMVIGSEVEEGSRLAESRIKDLTGGDVLTGRFLYAEPFEFHPTFKLWMFGNHTPHVNGTDYGIWRRIRLLPFSVQIPEAERDPCLLGKLLLELPGILNWAIEGCLAWQRERLKPPAIVQGAVANYREAEDVLGDFLSDMTRSDADGRVSRTALYQLYQDWCQREGIRHSMSSKKFAKYIRERGIAETKTTGQRFWIGISASVDENAHATSPTSAATESKPVCETWPVASEADFQAVAP
jgi:putative DNA primase/helicase